MLLNAIAWAAGLDVPTEGVKWSVADEDLGLKRKCRQQRSTSTFQFELLQTGYTGRSPGCYNLRGVAFENALSPRTPAGGPGR